MKAGTHKAIKKLFEEKHKALDKKFAAIEEAWEKKYDALEVAEEKALAKLEKQCLKDSGAHKFDQNGYCTRCGAEQNPESLLECDQEVELGPWS